MTVDIRCARCGKPMMMLSFNYTSLERGFESISLRCQYCEANETRPWPKDEPAYANLAAGSEALFDARNIEHAATGDDAPATNEAVENEAPQSQSAQE